MDLLGSSIQRKKHGLPTQRIDEYFLAKDVESPEKQRAILLSVCGASTYQKIRDLLAPEKPKSKSFTEIVKLVQDHHQPPPSFIVQRFNFNMINNNKKNSELVQVAQIYIHT